MKALIVHNILWSHYKNVIFSELEALSADYDCQVHVLQIARNEEARATMEQPGKDPDTYRYELLFDDYLERVGLVAKTRALVQRMLAFNPDVLTLTGYYDPAQLLLLLIAKLRGIKVIMQNESTQVDQTRRGFREWIKRRIVSLYDGFFCFGTHSADYMLELGVPPRKILLKKNAVDNDTLLTAYNRALPHRAEQQRALGLKPHNFVYVGRLVTVKNLAALLQAFGEARQQTARGLDWGLVLVGDGDQRAHLQRQVEELGLSDAVRFIDGQPWYRVPDYLALADVLVLPSLSEPWGLVVNEAMVCGMPVVVSDRCGCAVDLVRDGQNGYLFDPSQSDALTQTLLRFINGEADVTRMGRESKRLIAPYAPDAVAREMLAGFGKVVGKRLFHPAA